MKSIRNIFVAVDLQENTQKIVDLAIFMADKLNSEISFFHSIDFLEADAMGEMAKQKFSYDDYNLSKTDTAEKKIREFIINSVGAARTYPVTVEAGDFVGNILKQAVSQKADMIIIGTHGKQIQGKILLGSVAEQVLRAAHCPVLVTNPDN
jgi:nucleotide-binding universal stress UspA family protein